MQTVKQSAMALFLAVITFTASAHPHSFIGLQTELVTDGIRRHLSLRIRCGRLPADGHARA